MLGNGEGEFQPKTGWYMGGGPMSMAMGDFNGDGRMDVAATGFYSSTLTVRLGNGNGTFQTGTTYAPGIVII